MPIFILIFTIWHDVLLSGVPSVSIKCCNFFFFLPLPLRDLCGFLECATEAVCIHIWVRIGADRTHMITFDFDLNGTIIKWGCVRNKILKSTHSETAVSSTGGRKKFFLQHLLETHGSNHEENLGRQKKNNFFFTIAF
jgi:hypothetical protein